MSDSKAYIRDPQSLAELNNVLEYSADSLLKILEGVNNYLEGVNKTFEEQQEMLQKDLEAAQQALSDAENALSACEASQVWDEEEKEYRPSCSPEAAQVRLACEIRDKCQERVDMARRIVSACDSEIKKYKEPGGFVTPPGAEGLLSYLAKEHTDKATTKMRDILDVVEEYLACRMSIASSSGSSYSADTYTGMPVEDRPLNSEEKKERFNEAVERAITQQQEENTGSQRIADAHRVMRCNNCGRPYIACICNSRSAEYARENIHIIRTDNSI